MEFIYQPSHTHTQNTYIKTGVCASAAREARDSHSHRGVCIIIIIIISKVTLRRHQKHMCV